MNQFEFHRLLKRQIKKAGISEYDQEKLTIFFSLVNEAYRNFDKDYAHLENILETSSQELFKLNKQLKSNVETVSLKLDRVANNIQEVLFQTDLNGKWTYLNPAWESLTGFAVESSLGRSFKNFFKYMDEEGEKFLQEILEMNFKEKKGVFNFKNDKWDEWFEVNIKMTYNSENEPDGTIGTLVNISNLKKTELKLIKANAAKNDFLSIMSHEIRTPLNAVIGVSNLLLLNDPKPDQLENLNALKFSSEHLLSLINDILDFNKIESGKIEFEKADFSLYNLIEGLQKTFSFAAEEKGIKLKVKQDLDIPKVLVGDSMRLAQILTNLISNAIKFTSQGKVTIDIDVVDVKEDLVTLDFEISDTGIGIKKEHLDHIFDRFTQAEKTTSRKYGGTGLGLSICKKLLELQGSSLSVKSTFGEGTTFSFQLKFGQSDRLDSEIPSFINIQPSFSGLNKMSVLVAEDNNLNILVIKQFFKRWDVDFDIALNGQEALEMAQKNEYALILMDLQMPVMDGYESTIQIRKLANPAKANIPIVALTASAQNEILERALTIGMNSYLSKPFNPIDLYNTLKKYQKS